MPINYETLKSLIEKYEPAIKDKLGTKRYCGETLTPIEMYVRIMKTYSDCGGKISGNPTFSEDFQTFYQIRTGIMVTPAYLSAYYAAFDSLVGVKPTTVAGWEKTYRAISEKLSTIPTPNGRYAHQTSFISKMIHTADPNFPIIDQNVKSVLHSCGLSFAHGRGSTKIDNGWNDLMAIKDCYDGILGTRIKTLIDDDFAPVFDGYNISYTKKLDFILWTLGSIIKK